MMQDKPRERVNLAGAFIRELDVDSRHCVEVKPTKGTMPSSGHDARHACFNPPFVRIAIAGPFPPIWPDMIIMIDACFFEPAGVLPRGTPPNSSEMSHWLRRVWRWGLTVPRRQH